MFRRGAEKKGLSPIPVTADDIVYDIDELDENPDERKGLSVEGIREKVIEILSSGKEIRNKDFGRRKEFKDTEPWKVRRIIDDMIEEGILSVRLSKNKRIMVRIA